MKSKEVIIQNFLDEIFNETRPDLKDFKGNDELISIMDIALFLKSDSGPCNEYKENLRKEIVKYLPLRHEVENSKFRMKFIIGFVSSIFILFGLTFPFGAPEYLNKSKVSDTIVYQGYKFDNLKNKALLYYNSDYRDVFYFHSPNFFVFR
jgi:hypothetical protein